MKILSGLPTDRKHLDFAEFTEWLSREEQNTSPEIAQLARLFNHNRGLRDAFGVRQLTSPQELIFELRHRGCEVMVWVMKAECQFRAVRTGKAP
jgi:hypothetical protein